MNPTMTALILIHDRKTDICEVCNKNPGVEAHHCLYRRDRRVKNGSLDEIYNLQLVCYQCHHVTGLADSYENRENFWRSQVERYGLQAMLRWHERVPYKIKEVIYQ